MTGPTPVPRPAPEEVSSEEPISRPIYGMGENLPYLPNFFQKILIDEVRVHTNRSVVTVSSSDGDDGMALSPTKFLYDKWVLGRAMMSYVWCLVWANRGFCAPAVMVYLLIVFRCAMAVEHQGESEQWDELHATCAEWAGRGNDYVPSMLTSILPIFLVVFYVNAAIKRYYKMYDACREMSDITDQAVGIALIDFRKHPECLKEQVRCIHLARILALLHTAKDTYPFDSFFLRLSNCFGEKSHGLLTKVEAEKIRREGYSEHLSQYFTVKALGVVFAATSKGLISPPGSSVRMNHVNSMMEASQKIKRLTSMQYPPTYTYLVSSAVGISCMVEIAFASTRAGLQWKEVMFWESLVITMILLVAQQVCLFGILGVAGEMVDPFGSDIRDFPILHMCVEPLQHTVQLLWRYYDLRDDEEANAGFVHELGESERVRQKVRRRDDLQFRHEVTVGRYKESCMIPGEMLLNVNPERLGEHYSRDAEKVLKTIKAEIKAKRARSQSRD
eukprot:g2473.t1